MIIHSSTNISQSSVEPSLPNLKSTEQSSVKRKNACFFVKFARLRWKFTLREYTLARPGSIRVPEALAIWHATLKELEWEE